MTLVSLLFLIALMAAWFAHERWAASAERRMAANTCIRCGQREPEARVGIGETTPAMCVPCRQRTHRIYRAASWFFYLLAILFVTLAPRQIATDYRIFGARAAWEDVLLFAFGIALTVGAGAAIRHFGRKVV